MGVTYFFIQYINQQNQKKRLKKKKPKSSQTKKFPKLKLDHLIYLGIKIIRIWLKKKKKYLPEIIIFSSKYYVGPLF